MISNRLEKFCPQQNWIEHQIHKYRVFLCCNIRIPPIPPRKYQGVVTQLSCITVLNVENRKLEKRGLFPIVGKKSSEKYFSQMLFRKPFNYLVLHLIVLTDLKNTFSILRVVGFQLQMKGSTCGSSFLSSSEKYRKIVRDIFVQKLLRTQLATFPHNSVKMGQKTCISIIHLSTISLVGKWTSTHEILNVALPKNFVMIKFFNKWNNFKVATVIIAKVFLKMTFNFL